MSRGIRVIGALLLGGCGGDVLLGPPAWIEDRDGSYLAIFAHGAEVSAVSAGPLPQHATAAVPIDLGPVEDGDLWMVQSACTLEALGLEAGAIRLTSATDAADARLPPPASVQHARLSDDTASAWQAEPIPASIAAALELLPGPEARRYCGIALPRYRSESEAAVLEGSLGLASVEALGALADGTLIAGVEFYADVTFFDYLGAAVYALPAGGGAERLGELDPGVPRAIAGRGDEILVVDSRGLYSGPRSGPFTQLSDFGGSIDHAAIDVSAFEEPREIWVAVLGDRPSLTRFDDSGEHRIELGRAPGSRRWVSVTRMGPGTAAAIGFTSERDVTISASDSLTSAVVPVQGALTAIRYTPELGLATVSDLGELAVMRANEWVVVGKVTTAEARGLLAFGPGVAIVACEANCSPLLRPWHPSAGFCPSVNDSTRGLSQTIALPDGRIFGAGGVLEPDRIVVQRLSLERAAEPCANR